MRGSQVIQPVRTLKAVKSAVGDDVRHLEIFDYGVSGPTFEAFSARGFDAFEGPLGDIEVDLFTRTAPADIQVGDVIEYDIDQSGNWIDSGITWDSTQFVIFGPHPLGSLELRIRYRRGAEFSFPSFPRVVFITGGGPEG